MDVLSNRTAEGRKTVTVLFCDLVAYTELAGRLDPEVLRHLMLVFFERASAAIEAHGGTVEKFVGDEVMAVFGVPVVHEDDALRAVRAAVAVHECVAELDRESDVHLEVRIGINTGEVVTGDPSAGHGFVSGDAVAVGKRLEQAAAPGEIVLGEPTHRLVAHAVRATQLDPLTLKGKDEEATAFRLESVDPAATAIPRRDDTPHVGQQHELERLRSAYGEAASAGARLVTVVGDSGIGKSRLAQELLRSLDGEASVVVASCPPYGEGTTFSPIREAFQHAGRDESVLEGSSYEVFAATRSLFEELARERPLVAVFDDIHWAEETLLDLIEHLSVRLGGAHVLLLCLARPELAERRPQWVSRPETTLRLEALSDLDARGLLDALDAPAAVRERIAELAEGNPLFLEQLAAFAGEEGANVTLNGSIRNVLHARLDRLDPAERAVLERASVIGRSFPLEAVLRLIPSDEREQAHARMFELVRRGLVRPDVMSQEDGFRFQHALIREAVYEGMPKALRADLHETVAAQLDDAGDAAPAVVGFHLEHTCLLRKELGLRDAELAKRAGRLLRLAAEQTLSRTDAPATTSLLERARALLPADDRELSAVLTSLGAARLNGGDLPGAEAALVEAIDVAVATGQRAAELHARIELQFVRAFAGSTPVEESVALAQEAIVELEPLGDELALARAWWLRSSGDLAACRFRARGEAIEQALAHARRARAGVEMIGVLAGLHAQALLYGPTPVDEAITRVEGLAEELDLDATLRGSVHTSLAGLLALRGDLDAARRMFKDAAATYEEFGLRFRRATQSFVGAQIELLAGDIEAAEWQLRASSAAFDEIGAATSATTHRALLAEVVARRGGAEAEGLARQVADEALSHDLIAQVLWRCALARVRAGEGSAQEAAALATEARELLAEAEFPQLMIAALTAGAEVAAAANEGAEAERLLAEARQVAESKGAVASLAQVDAGRVAG
jgi:class 3 adenylate cyclase